MCQRATFGRHDLKHIACRCDTLMRYRPSVPFVAFWPKQITPRWQVRSSLQRLCERAPFLLLFMRQEGRCCASGTGPLLRFGYEARQQICFRKVCVRSRVCFRALSSQVRVVISPRLCVMRVSGQPSSSSAARTSLRIAHSLLQAQRSNRRQPRGDPFSASLRALMGEGVAFY